MGFACAIRDLFVEQLGWTSWRGESVAAAIAAKNLSSLSTSAPARNFGVRR